jgi:hypothetical protein
MARQSLAPPTGSNAGLLVGVACRVKGLWPHVASLWRRAWAVIDDRGSRLLTGMPGVVDFDAFGEKAFTAALAASRQSGAAGFGAHPGPKTVLVFAGAFRALKGAFHVGTCGAGWGQRIGAGRLGREMGMSTLRKTENGNKQGAGLGKAEN